MPDALTQLAKEFLEVHGYVVSTAVKMRLKGRKAKRTESDVDIIAHRYKTPIGYRNLPYNKTLENYIVAEVKSTYHGVDKSYFKDIKEDKFDNWNERYLQRYAPLSKMQKILFCAHATEKVTKMAHSKKIKIITAMDMLKTLSQIINRKEEKQNTYYTEWPIYSTLRMLIDFLNNPAPAYDNKLLLEDLLWITDPHRRRYRNNFVEQNRNSFVSLLYNETHHETLDTIMKKLRDDDWWYFFHYRIGKYFVGLPTKKRMQLIKYLKKQDKKLNRI